MDLISIHLNDFGDNLLTHIIGELFTKQREENCVRFPAFFLSC